VDNITELAQRIREIGDRLVRCPLQCEGIIRDPSRGILPRSLLLESADRREYQGSVALGINPGRCPEREQTYYLAHGNTFEAEVAFLTTSVIQKHPYHAGIRKFADAAGLAGPILWTELVKCENPPRVKGIPPLGTLRTCVNRFLLEELRLVPTSWPIIAIGRKPFELVAIMFPARVVLGIPHPTGSYGHFPRLFRTKTQLAPRVEAVTKGLLTSRNPEAAWLSGAA
jgi:hypothetical protein